MLFRTKIHVVRFFKHHIVSASGVQCNFAPEEQFVFNFSNKVGERKKVHIQKVSMFILLYNTSLHVSRGCLSSRSSQIVGQREPQIIIDGWLLLMLNEDMVINIKVHIKEGEQKKSRQGWAYEYSSLLWYCRINFCNQHRIQVPIKLGIHQS